MTEHWPRGTQVTRLYERDSLALSLTRSSGETRAHRSPSARPAILTVRRLLYSNGFLPPFSSAEFCSAYQSLSVHRNCSIVRLHRNVSPQAGSRCLLVRGDEETAAEAGADFADRAAEGVVGVGGREPFCVGHRGEAASTALRILIASNES